MGHPQKSSIIGKRAGNVTLVVGHLKLADFFSNGAINLAFTRGGRGHFARTGAHHAARLPDQPCGQLCRILLLFSSGHVVVDLANQNRKRALLRWSYCFIKATGRPYNMPNHWWLYRRWHWLRPGWQMQFAGKEKSQNFSEDQSAH